MNHRQASTSLFIFCSWLLSSVLVGLPGLDFWACADDFGNRAEIQAHFEAKAAVERLRLLAGVSSLRNDQMVIAEQLFFSFYLHQIKNSLDFEETPPWVAWVALKKGADNGVFSDLLLTTLARGSKSATHFSMASDAIKGLAEIQNAGAGKNLVLVDGLSTLFSYNELDEGQFQRGISNIVGLMINQKTPEGRKLANVALILVDDSNLLQYIDTPLYQRLDAVIDGFPPCTRSLGGITYQ